MISGVTGLISAYYFNMAAGAAIVAAAAVIFFATWMLRGKFLNKT
jgi:zinc transport system permease protein